MPDLTLTPAAAIAIRRMTQIPHLADDGGLRIARRAGESSRLGVGMTPQPEDGDVVVETSGARVFCGPEAARRLDGKRLNVRRDVHGRIEFVAQER